MKISHMLLLPALASFVLLAPSAVQAQGAPSGPGGDPMAIYKEAGATPDELQKISDMRKQFEGQAKGWTSKLQSLQEKIRDASLEPLPDEKKMLGLQDEVNKIIADVNTAHIKMMIQARAALTPPQRTKLIEILKKMKG
ncbi:MAG TPA: hypothetical protein V6D22_23030 [Candidatus Obscuribacterales bacterium]